MGNGYKDTEPACANIVAASRPVLLLAPFAQARDTTESLTADACFVMGLGGSEERRGTAASVETEQMMQ